MFQVTDETTEIGIPDKNIVAGTLYADTGDKTMQFSLIKRIYCSCSDVLAEAIKRECQENLHRVKYFSRMRYIRVHFAQAPQDIGFR